jgi:hypothetical protein
MFEDRQKAKKLYSFHSSTYLMTALRSCSMDLNNYVWFAVPVLMLYVLRFLAFLVNSVVLLLPWDVVCSGNASGIGCVNMAMSTFVNVLDVVN